MQLNDTSDGLSQINESTGANWIEFGAAISTQHVPQLSLKSLLFLENTFQFFFVAYSAASAAVLVLQSTLSLSVDRNTTPKAVNHSTHFPTSTNANVSLTNSQLMPGR
jgi:hypothetical protein